VLAGVSIEISLATANKATSAEKLVNRVKNAQPRHQDSAPARLARPAWRARRQTTTTVER
jgi:hypothetical protein